MLISELTYNNGECFTGEFRVDRPRRATANNGNGYLSFAIEDMSGALQAYAWQGRYHGIEALSHGDRIKLKGRLRLNKERWIADVLMAEPISVGTDNPVQLIPASKCPISKALLRLRELVDSIANEPLRHFVVSALSDDENAYRFVAAPASLKHHHNYPGGLLEHSLECVEFIYRLSQFDDETRELGMVAALFHDIGKIRILTPRMERTKLGYLLEHEALSLEILASQLRDLEKKWADGALALRYLLTWRHQKFHRSSPLMVIAEAISAADRISSGLNAEELAYKGHPDWHQFAKINDNSRFWRPRLAA